MINKYDRVSILSMKEEIIQALEEKGIMSTTRIAAATGISTRTKLIEILEELVREKKIRKRVETLATYWEIK